jgi:hypothetical protein
MLGVIRKSEIPDPKSQALGCASRLTSAAFGRNQITEKNHESAE